MFDQSLIIRLHWAEKTNNFGPENTSGQSQNRFPNSSQGRFISRRRGVVPIENVGFVGQRNDVAGVNEAAGTGDG